MKASKSERKRQLTASRHAIGIERKQLQHNFSFVLIGKLMRKRMREYVWVDQVHCNISLCMHHSRTNWFRLHAPPSGLRSQSKSLRGRLDTCEGLPGSASTHLLRPRHQLQLSLQIEISVKHRSRSCGRYSLVVSSALGKSRAYRIVSSVTQPLLCLAGLLFGQQQSLQAMADQV